MTRKKPNAWQKLVRGAVRNIINQANEKTSSRKAKSKKDKVTSNAKKQKSTAKKESTNRSRYIPKSIKVTVLHRDNFKCVFCGRTSKQIELQVDHIFPFAKGGSNDISNLQTLCIDCNQGKSDRILQTTV